MIRWDKRRYLALNHAEYEYQCMLPAGAAERCEGNDALFYSGVISGLLSFGMATFPLTDVGMLIILLTVLMAMGWDRMVLTLVTRLYSITGDSGGD